MPKARSFQYPEWMKEGVEPWFRYDLEFIGLLEQK